MKIGLSWYWDPYDFVNCCFCRARYEAHIWIPGPRKQIYLGGFDAPRAAACAHDIVALKVERPPSRMNFPRKL